MGSGGRRWWNPWEWPHVMQQPCVICRAGSPFHSPSRFGSPSPAPLPASGSAGGSNLVSAWLTSTYAATASQFAPAAGRKGKPVKSQGAKFTCTSAVTASQLAPAGKACLAKTQPPAQLTLQELLLVIPQRANRRASEAQQGALSLGPHGLQVGQRRGLATRVQLGTFNLECSGRAAICAEAAGTTNMHRATRRACMHKQLARTPVTAQACTLPDSPTICADDPNYLRRPELACFSRLMRSRRSQPMTVLQQRAKQGSSRGSRY